MRGNFLIQKLKHDFSQFLYPHQKNPKNKNLLAFYQSCNPGTFWDVLCHSVQVLFWCPSQMVTIPAFGLEIHLYEKLIGLSLLSKFNTFCCLFFVRTIHYIRECDFSLSKPFPSRGKPHAANGSIVSILALQLVCPIKRAFFFFFLERRMIIHISC